MAAREYEMGINVQKQEMLEGSKYMWRQDTVKGDLFS